MTKILINVIKIFAITAMTIVSILPFYILLNISLGKSYALMSGSIFYPKQVTLGNFFEAWEKSRLGISMINSLVITAISIIIIVFVCGSAGYTFARFPNKFSKTVFNIILYCMMVPPIINTVPLYVLMRSIGGINKIWAMILLMVTNSIPFSIFLYTNFIRTTSREIEESAIIDGCTWFSAFWRVTIHILKPVTASVVILNGMGIWNNYSQAIFFLQRQSVQTIPLAISRFFQSYGAKWHLMAAASVIGMLPIITTYLILQKYFVEGLSAGSVKQ